MSWRTFISKNKFSKIPILNSILHSTFPRNASTFPFSHHHYTKPPFSSSSSLSPISRFTRYIHSTRLTQLSNSLMAVKPESPIDDDDEDGTMNEFLSRFVWIMRKKVKEAYPESDKRTIDAMLLIIVEKVVAELEKGGFHQILFSAASVASEDFSEDLWKTVWEVSNVVLEDMNKERKKERMKGFLQCEEVKEMCRFAGEVGIRGDLLRELRFKWAREKMEEHDFYEGLELLKKEAEAEKKSEGTKHEGIGGVVEEKAKVVVTLPKRRGKLRFKIYGLDLSDPKWAQVAERINEAGQVMWPQEPKPITGKCKLVTEKILSLKEEDGDLATLLAEWVELLQPSRVDWMNLLDRLKAGNYPLYLKVAEMVLSEDSFQTNISDYFRLIDIYAKENQFDDAERILKKMNESGIQPDASTASALIHMYCKEGNLERAKEAFELLRSQGFQPDIKVYNSMIMAYINAGQPKMGEALMREMETRDIKPTKEIYIALLQSFSQRGDVIGAGRISTTMQFAGFEQTLETCTLLVEAHAHAGDPDQARSNFDYMRKFGHKPDDRCTASVIAAYEKKNLLDKALNLLLELEKEGFEPGVATYSVLVDWLGKLQLVDEVEQLLGKIALLGEVPPFKLQVSLCDMYARAGIEKKTLQTLGLLEARKDELGSAEFERIILSLIAGGFEKEARRVRGIMEAQGFTPSDVIKMNLLKPGRKSPSMR